MTSCYLAWSFRGLTIASFLSFSSLVTALLTLFILLIELVSNFVNDLRPATFSLSLGLFTLVCRDILLQVLFFISTSLVRNALLEVSDLLHVISFLFVSLSLLVGLDSLVELLVL